MDKKLPAVGSLVENVVIASNPCSSYQRTDEIVLINEAPVSVKICFAQLKCRYNVPAPYIKNTGVFVLATNLQPGDTSNIDCCDLSSNAPIAATSGTGSCVVIWPTNPPREENVTLAPWPEAAEGKFYRYLGWRLTASMRIAVADGSHVEVLEAVPIRAESMAHIDSSYL